MRTISLAPPTLQQRLGERARPDGSVVMLQRWEHLLLLHWRWDPAEVQRSLPPGLQVDVCEGAAWLGIVPLFMRNVRPRFVPAIPPLSDFFELNVRTYVYDARGRPGLYFYSLDCNQPLAVEAARRLLLLRYEHAGMRAAVDEQGVVQFVSARAGAAGAPDVFRYNTFGSEWEAQPESLDFFLVERYRLFAADENGERLNSLRVCHAPYRLRQAQVTQWGDGVLARAGFATRGRAPDHICAAEPVDVEVFAPEVVTRAA
jgi:uncharacterized protein YqjF (DUF2071 family)